MKKTFFISLAILAFTSCGFNKWSKNSDPRIDSLFMGLKGNNSQLQNPYITAGLKSCIIGSQDGSFPDIGNHVKNEMGGIWSHPIKLADGYWLRLSDGKDNSAVLLNKASNFTVFPHYNRFDYGSVLNGIEISSTQFSSDKERGVAITYTLTNKSTDTRHLNLNFILRSDLSPVWFSTENGIYDSPDHAEWNKNNAAFVYKDSINSWYAICGSNLKINSFAIADDSCAQTSGMGVTTHMRGFLNLKPGEKASVNYVLAGSNFSQKKAEADYRSLLTNINKEVVEKATRYKEDLQYSVIQIPDKRLEDAYYWSRINTQWLQTEVDTIGKFLTAGAVEYPWLFGCDNSYALQGVASVGGFDMAESTIDLLAEISNRTNGNGRIIHEMSTNGYVGNRGNTQETAHFIMAVWDIFCWTGNIDFLQRHYKYMKKGIQWLTTEMDQNGDSYPEGYGIMEVKGLNAELIDVAVYTQQALDAMNKMANILGDKTYATRCQIEANKMKVRINKDFWDASQKSYCDFYGTREEAQMVANGTIQQIIENEIANKDSILGFYKEYSKKLAFGDANEKRGWFINRNWVVNIPMECGIAPADRAIIALDKIRQENCGPYGPYLSAVEQKHMMTIATGVQAVSETRYGRADKAIEYMDMIAKTFSRNMPGAINEMMPNYGCPLQAWTLYALAKPLINGIFGFQPDAYHHVLNISPIIPVSWKYMTIKRVKTGDNEYSVSVYRKKGHLEYQINSMKKGWTTHLILPGIRGKKYLLNGKEFIATSDTITITREKITVIL